MTLEGEVKEELEYRTAAKRREDMPGKSLTWLPEPLPHQGHISFVAELTGLNDMKRQNMSTVKDHPERDK